MCSATVEQRRRDRILQELVKESVDDDRWFMKRDFKAVVSELWGDPRTVKKYWDNMFAAGTIECEAVKGKDVYGRLAEDVYNKLVANGTTLEVEAAVKITGRGRGRPKLIDAEMML